MSDAPLVLYSDAFWNSPYVFSCFVALREKGLPFTIKEVGLHLSEQRLPEYLASTLTGRVPALRQGEFWLAESGAIVEYLEETFGPPTYPRLLPEGAQERARARQILFWLRSDDTLPIRQERSAETIFYPGGDRPPLTDKGTAAAAKLFGIATRLLRSPVSTVFGTWTLVDADLAFMLHRLMPESDAMPDSLRAYAKAQWQRSSVAEYVAHKRIPYVRYF